MYGQQPHSYSEEDPTQADTWHFAGLTEEHCSQPYRIPTRHGKHAIFPREPVPAREGEIHIGDQTEAIHGYMYIHINIHIGDRSAAICGH